MALGCNAWVSGDLDAGSLGWLCCMLEGLVDRIMYRKDIHYYHFTCDLTDDVISYVLRSLVWCDCYRLGESRHGVQ